MNDTTQIGVATEIGVTAQLGVEPQMRDVHEYVAAVRSWLADLPGDEVEDLTAGMEADLAERAAETGERLGVLLGEPEAYAAELRSAAGLPPRAAPSLQVPPRGPGLVAVAMASVRARGNGILTRWPWLRELRPTWWLARGAVLGWLVALVLGTGRSLSLALVGAAVSFWLGLELRRRAPLRPVAGASLGVANVLAAIVLLPMLAAFEDGLSHGYEMEEYLPPYPSTVQANEAPVTNLYAYDAAGNRVDGVRLFDQAGRRVLIDTSYLFSDPFVDVPARLEDGMPDVAEDVFPVRWPGHDAWSGEGFAWTPPLVLAPVAGVATEGEPAPTPTPTLTPTPSVSPTASPSP